MQREARQTISPLAVRPLAHINYVKEELIFSSSVAPGKSTTSQWKEDRTSETLGPWCDVIWLAMLV